ncbi:MAG: cysteine--tRNA ligase [Herpetosiphonaceae bacterium]|nr:cysteine--tRNA ligase [Herpetosiphonaceae bacterium]
MRLFDTLAQQTKTIDFPDGVVKMYVCGITPYDTSHMGHARVGIVYDTLRRYLEWCGLQVRYVQNITDIDDPLFERARRDKVDWRVLGEQQTVRYLQSLAKVNVEQPHFYIKATSQITQMLPVITELIERGHAYVVDGAVYYSVASKPDFGTIFHQDYATMLTTANERGNDANDPHKRDPLDFVLWQHSQPDEPAWPSPWGPGRPGWHIECSTIATSYLGPQVDIHGGGTDLIFPHHACEIAQAEPITGVVPFVRAWMHVGMVYLDGEKMSKSLGNMAFVDDVLKSYSGAALRLATLKQPYHDPYEYREADIQAAEQQAMALRDALAVLSEATGEQTALDGTAYRNRFVQTLDDNFDTPGAIMILDELAAAIVETAHAGRNVQAAQHLLHELAGVLGLTF